jgi:hypothetical protein
VAAIAEELTHLAYARLHILGDEINFETVTRTENRNFLDAWVRPELGERFLKVGFGDAQLFAYFDRGRFMTQSDNGNIHRNYKKSY